MSKDNGTEMVFDDLAPTEVPVRLGKDRYILREASGEVAGRYRTACLKGVEQVRAEDGTTTFRRVQADAEVEPMLVSWCLYATGADGKLRLDAEGNPLEADRVPVEQVKRLPSYIQTSLFNRAVEISHLDETEDVAGLRDQIARLQKLLARMEAEQAVKHSANGKDAGQSSNMTGKEARLKNSPAAGPAGSV